MSQWVRSIPFSPGKELGAEVTQDCAPTVLWHAVVSIPSPNSYAVSGFLPPFLSQTSRSLKTLIRHWEHDLLLTACKTSGVYRLAWTLHSYWKDHQSKSNHCSADGPNLRHPKSRHKNGLRFISPMPKGDFQTMLLIILVHGTKCDGVELHVICLYFQVFVLWTPSLMSCLQKCSM